MVKIVVVDEHAGEGEFPTFAVGEAVSNLQACAVSPHWMSCTIKGFTTYIPDIFVEGDTLVCEYNPTELVASKGDILEVERLVYEWLYARNEKGACGWIPAEKILSVQE